MRSESDICWTRYPRVLTCRIKGSWAFATFPQKLSSTPTTLHPTIWK